MRRVGTLAAAPHCLFRECPISKDEVAADVLRIGAKPTPPAASGLIGHWS